MAFLRTPKADSDLLRSLSLEDQSEAPAVGDAARPEPSPAVPPASAPGPSVPRPAPSKPAEPPQREWAHVVKLDEDPPDYSETVTNAMEFPFSLDPFQRQAVYRLERHESVFVAAHTSAGKTVVADYAIALSRKHTTRSIYTSPIKALSNQKFRDFRETFGDESVGILTGDVQIRPEAPCLVMTTEILRSMLYRGADLIRDVEFVVFDEVHYINDIERGVVWEEVIIMLPAHITLILLSATVPNTKEFADWVGRTKEKDIYVITTPRRPVPLEHSLFVSRAGTAGQGELFMVVDAQKNFSSPNWKKAYDAASGAKKEAEKRERLANEQRGRGGYATRGVQARPGGAPSRSGPASSVDKNTYTHLISLLRKKDLLPAVVFTFSKRKCEEYAENLSNTDLTVGAAEKSEVHLFIEKSLAKLSDADRQLPQILRMRGLLSRGIAVHHGGLLPLMKEIVEILFARGLVRVLFATETFAMGVNMPARTVVFSSVRKHDGRSFRDLLPGEYTQMAGRAGRRGLDTAGTVIIACNDQIPESTDLQNMILGQPTKLESQFRLTYGMILNLLRIESMKVEDMIKQSFFENAMQKALPAQRLRFEELSVAVGELPPLSCAICESDLARFHAASKECERDWARLRDGWILKNPLGTKALVPGRVLVLSSPQAPPNTVAVLVKRDGEAAVVLALWDRAWHPPTPEAPGLLAASLPANRVHVPAERDPPEGKLLTVPQTEIACITSATVKPDFDALAANKPAEVAKAAGTLLQQAEATNRGPAIAEVDFAKIKDLDFQLLYGDRRSTIKGLARYKCMQCPDLLEHFAIVDRQELYHAQLSQLAHELSDGNLALLPDYHQRIEVLRRKEYIAEDGTVGLKGRVACEINTADALALTELVLDNFFADFEPAEAVALLSAFVFQEKSDSEPQLTPKLAEGVQRMKANSQRLGELQKSCGLDISVEDYLKETLNFGLVEVVYEWARAVPFKDVVELTDVLEGTIVRTIVRLDETCREVQGAAKAVGDAGLVAKMEAASASIRRDVVFATSLYFG
ncbi:NUC185 domain-containing protein [Hyaloraphidium curvatum]|nr:NUC185 domain-containing protein [Hyaloraphidium curvatum]